MVELMLCIHCLDIAYQAAVATYLLFASLMCSLGAARSPLHGPREEPAMAAVTSARGTW